MIRVFTWLWSGWRAVYDYRHVNALHRMLQTHHSSAEMKLTCITSDPRGIKCDTVPMIGDPPGLVTAGARMNCFRRLRLMDPAMQVQLGVQPDDIVANIDLDVLVRASLRPLFRPLEGGIEEWQQGIDFVGVKGKHALLNGSCWAFRAFTNWDMWTDFNPAKTPTMLRDCQFNGRRVVGSDQAWISLKLAERAYYLWDSRDGVLQYSTHGRYKKDTGALWAFAGGVKPWHDICRLQSPWIHKEYMAHFNARE